MSAAAGKSVCVVIGVGPGNGAALVGKFAMAGYRVAMIARSPDTLAELEVHFADAKGNVCDVADAEALNSALAAIERDEGPVEVLVYNAGKGLWGDALEVSAQELRSELAGQLLRGLQCRARRFARDDRTRGREHRLYWSYRFPPRRCEGRRLCRRQGRPCVAWRSRSPAPSVQKAFMSR